MCTYNGQTFLPDQLASILAQSYPPIEVVILDDGSEDDTCAIINNASNSTSLPIHLHSNPERLGPAANFARAASLSSGELIAFCDQDDFWLPHKLEKFVSILARQLDTVAAFSDAKVVDAELKPFGYTMWQQVGFTPSRQQFLLDDRPWDVLFKDPVVTGATLIFRRELLPLILPIPKCWMHDAWIAQIAASQGRIVAVPEPLILYRQHVNNVIGGKKLSFFEQIRRADTLGRLGLIDRELKRYRVLRDRLASFPKTPRCNVMLLMAEAKIAHLVRRGHVPTNRLFRFPVLLREFLNGNYRRFAKDWRNVLADLLMP